MMEGTANENRDFNHPPIAGGQTAHIRPSMEKAYVYGGTARIPCQESRKSRTKEETKGQHYARGLKKCVGAAHVNGTHTINI